MPSTTVFKTRTNLSTKPVRADAMHEAVPEARLLGVGALERSAVVLGDDALDAQFDDEALMPGLVEGHAPLTAGRLAPRRCAGLGAHPAPAGRVRPGCRSVDEVAAPGRTFHT